MDILKFNYNWNNKLNNIYFTTIRLWNVKKYFTGNKFEVYLKNQKLFNSEIIEVKKISIEQINNYIAGIDTGYNVKETKKMLIQMYGTEVIDKKKLAFVLLKKITP